MAHKIGIGITWLNRKEHLALCMEQLSKFMPENAKLHIEQDVNKKGVAFVKNQCLKELKDCDYIFLFDDDTFPIQEGWEDLYIGLSNNNKHLLYLNHSHVCIDYFERLKIYKECGGALIFLTKEVVEKVGGFYPHYDRYGFEHAGYSQRIHKAGFTPDGQYLCPSSASEFICCLDYDKNIYGIKHKPSLLTSEVIKYAEINKGHYFKERENLFYPLV